MKVGNRGRREGPSDTTQRNFIGQIGINDLLVKISQSFVLLCGFLNSVRVEAKTEALQKTLHDMRHKSLVWVVPMFRGKLSGIEKRDLRYHREVTSDCKAKGRIETFNKPPEEKAQAYDK